MIRGDELKRQTLTSHRRSLGKATSTYPPKRNPCRDYTIFRNPDYQSTTGIVTSTYTNFKTTFWIDRTLLWLTVFIPIAEAIFLIIIHAIFGVSRCLPSSSKRSLHLDGTFVDRFCGLQLTYYVLKGDYSSMAVKNSSRMQLQHECYPFLLLFIAAIMWIPHHFHQRSTDRTARRDLCLVRCELHSIRSAISQELHNYFQNNRPLSTEDGISPAQEHQTLFPQAGHANAFSGTHFVANSQCACPYEVVHRGPTSGVDANTSFFSQSPTPTVIPVSVNGSRPPLIPMGATRTGAPLISHHFTPTAAATIADDSVPTSTVPPLCWYADADLSAPGLWDLPHLQACQTDWSLNTYLSVWQNTEFYWKHFLTKHLVLAFFQLTVLVTIFTAVALTDGAPFVAHFTCSLVDHGYPHPVACMLQSTFVVNMSFLSLGCLTLASLFSQVAFFYTNFVQCFGIPNRWGKYLGLTSRSVTFVTGMDEAGRCFFADYIRLLAYTAFRDAHCEIRNLSVTYLPGLYRSDFHFVSLLCTENSHLLPDAMHLHFWIERYARLCKRYHRRPYWSVRHGSMGHLVRCEDLSMKFKFSKIRIKVEVTDFAF